LNARFSPKGSRAERATPLSPLNEKPPKTSGDFYFQMAEPGLPERGQMKIKGPYERSE
jgi:hypothetical protein